MLNFTPYTIDSYTETATLVDTNDREALSEAFEDAIFRGQLHIVNRLLEIPYVFNNTNLIINGLFTAIHGGKVNVLKRLLQSSAAEHIDPENAVYLLRAATTRANTDSYIIFNHLLEASSIRNNANGLNNQALLCAVNRRRLDLANRLLEIPIVATELKHTDREAFIALYRQVLDGISTEAAVKLEEIRLVNTLIDIGEQYPITEADFSKEQLINARKCTSADLLTALLYALDDTSDEHIPNATLSFAYDEARSSVSDRDEELGASSPKRRCTTM